jgi:hypothetical protein
MLRILAINSRLSLQQVTKVSSKYLLCNQRKNVKILIDVIKVEAFNKNKGRISFKFMQLEKSNFWGA